MFIDKTFFLLMVLENKNIHNSREGKISLIVLVNNTQRWEGVVIFRNFSEDSADVTLENRIVLETC